MGEFCVPGGKTGEMGMRVNGCDSRGVLSAVWDCG